MSQAFDLPDFATLAVDLFAIAQAEARAVEGMETFVARLPLPAPGMQRSLNDVRRTAAELGQLYHFFRALIPHEAAVRALATTPADTKERAA